MKSADDKQDVPSTGSSKKRRGLGQGLTKLLAPSMVTDQAFSESKIDCNSDLDSKIKFGRLIESEYRKRYPCAQVSCDSNSRENFTFNCCPVFGATFRVQPNYAGWPRNTLVIACINYFYLEMNPDPILELFNFLISIQEEIGYISVGIENPGTLEMPFVERFGLTKLNDVGELWSISIDKLKQQIVGEDKSV